MDSGEMLPCCSDSLKDLNDKLVALERLHCAVCKQIPLGPIFTYNRGQDVLCEPCSENAKPEDAVPNGPLAEVLKLLKYPCPYKKNGCREESDYADAEAHKSACVYRSYVCPLSGFGGCTWSGHSSQIAEHFEANHGDCVLKAEGPNTFAFAVSSAETASKSYLLPADEEFFLLCLRFSAELNKLFHKMYHIGCDNFDESSSNAGNAEPPSGYRYSIEPSIKTNCHLELEGKCAPFSSFDAKRAPDDADSALDFAVLRQIAVGPEDDAVNMKVAVKSARAADELDEKLLSFFECPVCNNFMKPPIFQCLSGHSLCSRCRPKLGHCPTCRASFGSTRNFALESMTNGVRYPCIYRDLGCRKILPVANIVQHESECLLRPYTCPFHEMSRCHWEGTHAAMKAHLNSSHGEKVRHGDFHQTTIAFSFDQQYYDTLCVLTLGEIFRVCHRRDVGNQNGYWSVQLVGPRGEAKKFKYEVGLVDARNDCRRLIRVDLCQDLTNQDNMFNQCILIPITIISWFACNNQISYYVKISRR